MKTTTKRPLSLLAALALAGTLTLPAGLGALKTPDLAVSDALYQERMDTEGKVILVGIDQRALEEFGPYAQWGRDIIARTIDALNVSEDGRPAVIGLDVLYTGETDPELDGLLAQAAGRYGNVITACSAQFGREMVPDEREEQVGYSMGDVLRSMDRPYEALAQAAQQGHINAMLDSDGILRHHLLEIGLEDGSTIPSLALAAANHYRAHHGEGPVRRPPTNAQGFWYVPFCGVSGVFECISVSEVLAEGVDANRIGGKIVLIGPYAAGLQDSYMTAADHAWPMYGVEYQANAIRALLKEDYKTEVRKAPQLLALFLLLLLALAGFWRRPVKWAAALWAALCGGWVLLCLGAYRAGWVLHVLWVPAGVTVLFALCLALNYVRAALERQRVTATFQRYVAPEIVSEILKEGTDALGLGGKKVRIAVLFVDIRGFTTLSERLKSQPEKVVGILNRYLTFMAECILKNGGTLDKFVGDEAMAFWGAPVASEDFVFGAARAAMDMVEGMQDLSRTIEAEFGYGIAYGVGIHLGEAVVGNVGSAQRMDYTAIGDTVNIAARLQGKAGGGIVYVSRAVADALEGRAECSPAKGEGRLKGKTEEIEVLTLDRLISL